MAAQTHRERMDGDVGIHVRVGQLEPRDHQQAVVTQRPLRHAVDGVEIRGVGALADRLGGGVGGAYHVVGDAEDVESPLAVEVGEAIEIELAVAPGAVRVQLAQERAAGLSGSGGHTRRLPRAGILRGCGTAKRR